MALSEYPDWEYPYMPVEDYLLLDKKSKNIKYEYWDGQLYMLAGGSSNHSAIATNLARELGIALKKTPCIVYNSDVHIKCRVPDRIDSERERYAIIWIQHAKVTQPSSN